MAKFLSYSPLTIVIILGISAVFYVLTAEEIIFLSDSKKEPVPQKILPEGSAKPGEMAIEEPPDSGVPVSDTTQAPVTTPVPTTKPKPIGQAQPVEVSSPVEVPSGVVEGPKTHTVYINAGGLEPRILMIERGDTVRWINNDTHLHWPASDPHPTHTGLPEFDPLADILPRESYSFTFVKPGVYGYHDHTQSVVDGLATLTGIIRVLEK